MFAPDDTIVAVATPPGRGAIGVVRLSGPQAHQITDRIATRRAAARVAALARVQVLDAAGCEAHDDAVVVCFEAPHSYTGEHVAEISAHGNPLLLEGIVRAALRAGARLAEPGEFTLRAFLNGKRDLLQAEAVADLIEAATPLQARAAADQLHGTLTARIGAIDAQLFDLLARLEASLDFPDEGYHFVEPSAVATALTDVIASIDALLADAARGRLLRDGATVVIAGRPNVGKSSLFNALVGAERAIVTEVPGTTRDLVAERVDIEGLALTLVDTAGARDTSDRIEREGVARSVTGARGGRAGARGARSGRVADRRRSAHARRDQYASPAAGEEQGRYSRSLSPGRCRPGGLRVRAHRLWSRRAAARDRAGARRSGADARSAGHFQHPPRGAARGGPRVP